ncbi:hypothetical protein B0T17DRAFT_629784 [Bombardia bombarda]|uniref:Uncharacterized protein n=1 Tax=Bombardia bombarda TaxID=252184 RepID=A0AA39W9R1_9PEZI|nr:hypothetical protein B0T17DRAFT_629784 [Bombardia bombarda]
MHSQSPARLAPPPPAQLEIIPTRQLTDKGKAHDIFHIDCSPSSAFIATKHANNIVKVWSIAKNAVHSSIKITSYVQPQARSREYFIRSHAILSESATLIGITTHFGFNLEIYNFAKAGSSGKKVQVIEDAHRWAAAPSLSTPSYSESAAPLKPFWEDTTSAIELRRANLPFIPKFPELAYASGHSSNSFSPFLVAAAGPRPGDPPRVNASTILIAWQMTPASSSDGSSSIGGGSSIGGSSGSGRSGNRLLDSLEHGRHRPYRVCVPDYPALQNSLPAALVAHAGRAVSVWIPANHADIPMPGGKFRSTPVACPERFVLVWDYARDGEAGGGAGGSGGGTTRIVGIPNVQACISPDCRYVAYCDPGKGRFVILDVESAEEVWRWPDARNSGFASFGGQLENLGKVTVFEFSADGRLLVVGDASGGWGSNGVKVEAKQRSCLTRISAQGNGREVVDYEG